MSIYTVQGLEVARDALRSLRETNAVAEAHRALKTLGADVDGLLRIHAGSYIKGQQKNILMKGFDERGYGAPQPSPDNTSASDIC